MVEYLILIYITPEKLVTYRGHFSVYMPKYGEFQCITPARPG
jgi:hypothetical protein